jgi:hypothetical protein
VRRVGRTKADAVRALALSERVDGITEMPI